MSNFPSADLHVRSTHGIGEVVFEGRGLWEAAPETHGQRQGKESGNSWFTVVNQWLCIKNAVHSRVDASKRTTQVQIPSEHQIRLDL